MNTGSSNNDIFCCNAECPLLAQSGHRDTLNQCPLLGVKRTWTEGLGYPCPECNPHSFFASSSHHQRPARSSSPGAIGRVQGAHPMEAKPLACRGLTGIFLAAANC